MKYFILLTFALYSCTTQRQVVNYLNKHEDVASEYCAEKYPVKTDTMVIVQTDTTLLKEYITEIDSIEIHDTICNEFKEKIKYIIKNNPPITKTITIEKENVARVKALQLQIERKDKQIDDLLIDKKKFKHQSKVRLNIILFLLLLLLGFIAAKFLPIK